MMGSRWQVPGGLTALASLTLMLVRVRSAMPAALPSIGIRARTPGPVSVGPASRAPRTNGLTAGVPSTTGV